MNKKEIDLTDIGKKLKFLRIKAGYTSFENFAIEHDISSSYYWKTEQGLVNIGMKYFLKLLKIHSITPQDFFESISDISID